MSDYVQKHPSTLINKAVRAVFDVTQWFLAIVAIEFVGSATHFKLFLWFAYFLQALLCFYFISNSVFRVRLIKIDPIKHPVCFGLLLISGVFFVLFINTGLNLASEAIVHIAMKAQQTTSCVSSSNH